MPETRLDAPTRSRLILLYLLWSLVLLGIGTAGLLDVTSQIGTTYGGFVWTQDSTRDYSFFVTFELWRSLPPAADEVRLLDEIVTVDGRSPWDFGEVYGQAQPGDLVTYELIRDGELLVIREPVRVFTWDKFLISHGLLYLAGLSYVFSGLALIRSTTRKDLMVFSFALLLGGGAWLSHGDVRGIHAPYAASGVRELLLYTPAMPFVGALLLHFSALFPTPKANVLSRRLFPGAIYLIAFLLVATYTFTKTPAYATLHTATLVAMFILAILGMFAMLANSFTAYLDARKRKDSSQVQILKTLSLAWLLGTTIIAVLGMLPVLLIGYPLLPFEILITLAMLFPVALVYAVRNAELIGRLSEEIELRRQYGDQVKELQNIRERILHEVADSLHDLVMPELRGAYFAATAAQRQAAKLDAGPLADDLDFICRTLDTVSLDVRAIMEDAKPIDWQETDLKQALGWLVNGLQRWSPRLKIGLDVEGYDEADPLAVKEALYWIARAALSNVQDHSGANAIDLSLLNDGSVTRLSIRDDGVGFDPVTVRQDNSVGRRHLGLENMRLRAREINARLLIESGPGTGTRIEAVVPRGGNL